MTDLAFRPAGLGDADLLFDWVNRPDCLAGKLRTDGPIPRASHDAWFAARLGESDCRLWIVERGGVPVGQIRLQAANGAYEVDVYVVPTARRAHVAAAAVGHAVGEMATAEPGARLVARVRSGNAASRRLFESVGFALCETRDDHIVFEYLA